METDKNSRLLYLYEMLVHGEELQKKEAAARFGVNERSIQRDIDCLRNFFASQEPPQEILYNAKEQRYELTSAAESFLSCGELLAVCKILLDSRSMPKDEMEPILDKLLSRCASPQSRKLLGQILANERFYYVEPHHGKRLSNQLWTLGQAIWSHSVVEAVYRTQQGERKSRRLQPVGLLFSEFYFYLTAFIEDIDREKHFENADDPFPTGWIGSRRSRCWTSTSRCHTAAVSLRGSSGSGSSSCTAGNWKRCILSIKGHPWRRYWTGSPRRRSSVSTTDAMRSAQRSLARALKCG